MRVLIVEDDPSFLQVLVEVLREEGHDTLTAVDGLTALTLAEAELPDLIILDILIPVIDGASVARQLKRHPLTQSIHILAMSIEDKNLLSSRLLPADVLLPKPFDITELLSAMASLG